MMDRSHTHKGGRTHMIHVHEYMYVSNKSTIYIVQYMYIVHINTTSLTHVHVPRKKKTMPLHTKTAIHVNMSNCKVFKTCCTCTCISLIVLNRELHFAHLESDPVSIEVMHHFEDIHIQISGKILRILYLKPALTCT